MTDAPEVRRTIRLGDPEGLHARPCALIARTASRFRCRVEIRHGGRAADARFVLELLQLSVLRSVELEVVVVGKDAVKCLAAIERVIADPGES